MIAALFFRVGLTPAEPRETRQVADDVSGSHLQSLPWVRRQGERDQQENQSYVEERGSAHRLRREGQRGADEHQHQLECELNLYFPFLAFVKKL